MADIIQTQRKQKAGVARTKKLSLRVDLTPMVDLGFLLISFFVFTTTIAQPKALKLVLPDDNSKFDSLKIAEDKTLNLVLGAGNNVYVYNGREVNNIKNIGSNPKPLRTILFNKKNLVRSKYGSDKDVCVLIKPTVESSYADVINALDEMLICDIKTYILVDADSSEVSAVWFYQ